VSPPPGGEGLPAGAGSGRGGLTESECSERGRGDSRIAPTTSN
jgi:hypothetical protein